MKWERAIKSLLLLVVVAQAGWAGTFDKDYSDLDDFLVLIVPKDGIPAMTNPLFMTADEATYTDERDLGTQAYVADSDRVLGVNREGVAKAYPLNLGWWHEVINDRIGDRFITVTYCPLTGTGLVFDTTDADGHQIELGVSGWLLNSNLVMYDRRDERTLYPQMVFTGINSTFKGDKLKLLPAVETTWGTWKKMYPETEVPRFATGLEAYSERRRKVYENRVARYYESQGGYPYGTYRTDDDILFPLTTDQLNLGDLHIKDIVLGVCQDGQTKAYPFPSLPDQAVINDQVGSQALLIVFHGPSGTAIPYRRAVDGQVLTFYAVEPADGLPVAFRDVETGSRWNMLGLATDGPLQGRRLDPVPAYNSMLFAGKAYWPDTAVWEGEGILTEAPSTAVGEQTGQVHPPHFVLWQNYPNPFNSATRIAYDLPHSGLVHLTIFNALGQQVRTLLEASQQAGFYRLNWDGRDDAGAPVRSGTYFYRLAMPEITLRTTKSMVLAR